MKRINSLGYILTMTTLGLALTAEAATVRVTGGSLYLGNKVTATNFILGSAATMSGNGEIRAPATLSGTVSPGNSTENIGTLSFSDRVAFDSGSFVCYAATDTSLDRISVTGNVTGAATVQMTRAADVAPLRQVIIKGGADSDYAAFGVSPSSEWVLSQMNALDLVVSFGQSPPAPPAPQNVSASDGTYGNKVAITWSAASDATGYQVWRHRANDSSSATMIGTASQTSYNDTRAAHGILYYYWVKATNAAGASAFSSSDSGWRARVRADPVMIDNDGNWYVWFSGSGYQMGGPWSLGVSGTPVAADFDGDGYTDVAIVNNIGTWYVWFTSMGYQMGGPWSLGVSGSPVAADFDGDGYADPAMVDNAGNWYVWFTSTGYQMGGPWNLGVLGTPVAADFDGDGYADPAMVDNAGNWYVWFTSTGYQMGGPWNLGVLGKPVAADFDADGYADPAMVDNTGNWYVWFTSTGYQMSGPFYLGVSGTPVAADFDNR